MKRTQRQPEKMKLTENDVPVLEAVLDARYLTTDMLLRLCFKDNQVKWGYKRLRALFNNKYLDKRVMQLNAPDVYYLGLRGRHYFERLGYDKVWLAKVAGTEGDEDLFMRHDLTVSKLYVNAVLEAREHGWTIRWKNERMLDLENLGVRPDAWIEVEKDGRTASCYIEFTASLRDARDVEPKLKGYANLPGKVKWFTTTKAKLNSLIRWVDDPKFAFALIEDSQWWLTAPIWRWQGEVWTWIVMGGKQ